MEGVIPFIFTAGAGLVQGIGAAQGQDYQAQVAKRNAQIARVQADQVDAQYRQDLSSTLSNIRAIRASAGGGADSPSTIAYMDKQEKLSDQQRRIEVGNRRMQASSYDAEAQFRQQSATWSLLGGGISGLANGFATL